MTGRQNKSKGKKKNIFYISAIIYNNYPDIQTQVIPRYTNTSNILHPINPTANIYNVLEEVFFSRKL